MDNISKLTDIFAEAFLVSKNEVSYLEYRKTAAWDSVGHMTLVAAIEENFDIMLDTDDIIEMNSFKKCKEILNKYDVEF